MAKSISESLKNKRTENIAKFQGGAEKSRSELDKELIRKTQSIKRAGRSNRLEDVEAMAQILMLLVVKHCQQSKAPLNQIKSIIKSRNEEMRASQLVGIIQVLGNEETEEE